MGSKTDIGWTKTKGPGGEEEKGATWNTWRGCDAVSPGCANCYAQTIAARFCGEGQPYEGTIRETETGKKIWSGQVNLAEDHWTDPLRWTKPRKVFVNSMSDTFHESITFEQIAAIFAVMAMSPTHTFQILTKRPERMVAFFKWLHEEQWPEMMAKTKNGKPVPAPRRIDANVLYHHATPEMFKAWKGTKAWLKDGKAPRLPLKNVWLGVTVESQKTADERIPLLLQTPAHIRWLSIEPLLGLVKLTEWTKSFECCNNCGEFLETDYAAKDENGHALDRCKYCEAEGHMITTWGFAQLQRWRQGVRYEEENKDDLKGLGLDWVVVGGESGDGARPMHPAWVRSLRDECVKVNLAFFLKQWGWNCPLDQLTVRANGLRASGEHRWEDGTVSLLIRGKKYTGNQLDGVTWEQFPGEEA